MVKDIVVVANDIKLYYRGFELALERDQLDDAFHYLKEIKREVDDYLDYLHVKRERAVIEEAVRKNLKDSLKEHKTHVKKLKRELKKHKFALSDTPDESKITKKPSKIPAVFPTILKAVQIQRADPEKAVNVTGPLESIPVERLAKTPLVVSNVGEEVQIQEEDDKKTEEMNEIPNKSGAPVKPDTANASGTTPSTEGVQIQKGDREKLVKVAGVNECLSLSQWSEILGFIRSSSAHQFLERMSDKGLVDLQKSMEGVEVRLSGKGKSILEEFELAGTS